MLFAAIKSKAPPPSSKKKSTHHLKFHQHSPFASFYYPLRGFSVIVLKADAGVIRLDCDMDDSVTLSQIKIKTW